MKIRKQHFDKIILRGGKIIIPGKKIIDNPDIYIEQGKIVSIKHQTSKHQSQIPKPNIKIVQLDQNNYISPGFIDMHCHLREPGNTESETIKTGTLSAIAGGFTIVCCMPNTNPPLDNPKLVKYIYNQSNKADNAQVLVIGCATKKRAGKKITDINALKKAGVVAFSDDGSPIADSQIMQDLLERSKTTKLPVINHCEVLELSNQGELRRHLGLSGIPDNAESLMVLRDLMLADYTEGHVHIAHISNKKSVDLIRWAKKRGINVTAETCPRYFTLTERDCSYLNTNYKVSPPLRTITDVEAIKQGLADGTIDAIATDHAPWHRSKKQVKWDKAKPGMIGFETAFSLGYQELVLKKYFSLEKLIACLTINPAHILGLENAGEIKQGMPAAITIFDLNKTWIQTKENIVSKSKNSPYIGKKLIGKIEKVIIKDKLFTII